MDIDIEVVVIGGGLAGLAAATTAARAGRRVLLLEARAHPGGRARTADRHGFLLNEGAHALYRDGEGFAVLRALDIEPDGEVPDPKGTMGWRDGHLSVFPTNFSSLARTDLLGARAKLELGRLLATFARLRPEALGRTTVAAWVDEALREEASRAIVHTLVRLTTYADDPAHLSADAALTQLQRAAAGNVLYLHGGWQRLVDDLMERARDAGVRIDKGAKVEGVRPHGRAVEVRLRGRSLDAKAVIVAVGGPAALPRLLEDAAPVDAVNAWAERARPAHAACLDVGLRGGWGDAPGFVLGVDRPLYFSVITRAARVAPPGDTLVTVMKYLRPGEASDPQADRGELQQAFDRIRPGWRDDAADVVFRPRLVAATDIPRAELGGLAGRPDVEVPDLPGVYVAGDWVGPAGVLADAALASGARAGAAAAQACAVAAA